MEGLWRFYTDRYILPLSDPSGCRFRQHHLGATQDAFADVAPKILPGKVAAVEEIDDAAMDSVALEDVPVETDEEAEQQVQIDWAARLRPEVHHVSSLFIGHFGVGHYDSAFLYFHSRALAPKGLAEKVCACIEKQDYDAAVALCRKKPSTLGNALSFIVEHRDADWEAVCQTAGDMAARDIRGHLSRIYPLSVISSLSPFGVVRHDCGYDRAFGLVALFGDEGGASILSDSISKALITTAAGLIVAMPPLPYISSSKAGYPIWGHKSRRAWNKW